MALFESRIVRAPVVVDGVLEMLARNELKPMQQYPSAADLRRRFRVSRGAVRHATEVLIRAGVVESRRHGRLFLTTHAADPAVAAGARRVAATG